MVNSCIHALMYTVIQNDTAVCRMIDELKIRWYPMTSNSPKTFILLLDGGSASRGRVRRWLTDRGFITWEANDVCHAIEEVSDFTVKRRPDVVLLEVPAIPDCFDTFKSTFQVSPNELSIVALSESPSDTSKPFVASSLNQLKMYMDSCLTPA